MSIIVYTRTGCAPCKTVKRYFDLKKISYEEKNIDLEPGLMDEILRKTGYSMVPMTEINGEIVTGANISLISSKINAIIA